MGTIADKLELLRRTKERQRAYLEQKYPLLDFDTIPFRAYLDLFQGRSYIPGFVGGWKAYGRSNDEDASTRDILPDYSGNGRDIKLYNFAFEGGSGFNGFVTNTYLGDTWGPPSSNLIDITINNDKTKAKVTRINEATQYWVFLRWITYEPVGTHYKVKIKITGLSAYNETYNKSVHITIISSETPGTANITEDGIYEGEFVKDENTYKAMGVTLNASATDAGDCDITIEQIPDYPGALVADGIDDYGECVKGFALPDDYTVVAIRKLLNSKGNAGLVGKSGNAGYGAFIFEYASSGSVSYSYGGSIRNSNVPALFSYLTKTSFNGVIATPGTAEDGSKDKLTLFHEAYTSYKNAALYDLRIYDHSLTAEELQTVKDEMMTDYENATGGGIADITYVADWDAKGRSNDEEETMRSQWIDKVNGKVINLSNYSFSEMSGWGGYAMNWADGWSPDYFNIIQYTLTSSKGVFFDLEDVQANQITLLKNANANIPAGTIIRLSITGLLDGERLAVTDNTNPDVSYTKTGNGILEFTPENTLVYVRMTVVGLQSKANRTISIEQLPLYPGALVNDGVDDYGKTADTLTESIGTALAYAELIEAPTDTGKYILNAGSGSQVGRVYLWRPSGLVFYSIGTPEQQYSQPPFVLSRTPSSPNNVLTIGGASENSPAKSAIFRLIFIKEQLDDAQTEFLKWKVEKEYRDWCKANGYEYAIPEMTEESATN